MKKLLTALLILALSITLWACGNDQVPTTPSGTGSTPSASQPGGSGGPSDPSAPSRPGGEAVLERPVCRPAHNLGAFTEIVGWYTFEYEGDSRYPSKVTATGLNGDVRQYYELVLDENGLPVQMVIKDVQGEINNSQVELVCDAQGNIVEVGIYEGTEKIGCYRLAYDENGRMITTTMDMEGVNMVMSYDERYCITRVVATQGENYAVLELAYNDAYQVIKRLVKDRDGAIREGFEETYNDAGVLTLRKVYTDGICSEEIAYNEKGNPVSKVRRYRMDAQLREEKQTYEYDDQDRVVRYSEYVDQQLTTWTEMTYDGQGCYSTNYDANGTVLSKAFTQLDEQNRILKNIAYDAQGNVLETREYAYDAAGHIIRNFLYGSDGTLLRAEESAYDAYDNVIKNMIYDANGLVEGWEREYDAEGNTLKRVEYSNDGSYEVREYLPGQWSAYRSMVYDAEGILLCGYEWEYDADGNATKYTSYELDGSYTVEEYRPGQEEAYKSITYDAQGNIYSGYEEQYDINGRLTEKTEYEPDGWKSVYTYGESGEYTANYYQNGQLRQTIVSDAMDNITLIVSYDENGLETERYEASYTYYESGALHTRTVYEPDGQLYTVYDERGNQIEHTITEWDADGNVTFEQKWVYTYDENDTLRKEEMYINGYLDSVTEYNENGVISRKTEHYPYGTFVHEYDERGFEIAATDYDLDGTACEKWVYERYDNGQAKVRLRYYADGTLREQTEFTENGLETFWEFYAEDGTVEQKFTYSAPGVKSESVYYPEQGGKEVTHFDEQGREIRIDKYNSQDVLTEYTVYTYYDSGIAQSIIGYYANGTVKHAIYFDENGNMIQ